MSASEDDLERELASLRPRSPSEELCRSIDARISVPEGGPRSIAGRRRLVWAAATVSLVSAALAIRGFRPSEPAAVAPVVTPTVASITIADDWKADADRLPFYGTYSRVLRTSPESLMTLLDERAARRRRTSRPGRTYRFFDRITDSDE